MMGQGEMVKARRWKPGGVPPRGRVCNSRGGGDKNNKMFENCDCRFGDPTTRQAEDDAGRDPPNGSPGVAPSRVGRCRHSRGR